MCGVTQLLRQLDDPVQHRHPLTHRPRTAQKIHRHAQSQSVMPDGESQHTVITRHMTSTPASSSQQHAPLQQVLSELASVGQRDELQTGFHSHDPLLLHRHPYDPSHLRQTEAREMCVKCVILVLFINDYIFINILN